MRFRAILRTAVLLPIFACAFASAGCAVATVPDSVLTRVGGNAPEQQLDYWHEIATKTLLSNDEALHGLLLYLDGKDDATSYEQRVATLRSRGYLPRNFDRPANEAVQRGNVAVTLAKSLDIKGGLTVRFAGFTPRYAARELEYRGIYPTSSTNQVFTGGEFVGVIGKAEDFRQGDPTNLPAAELPPAVAAAAAARQRDEEVVPILAIIQQAAGELRLQPMTAGASTTQAAGPVRIIVTAVEGLASVRENENAPWKPATKGMELGESAEFRTGPRGTVQFVIPPNQVVSVDRLTTLKVLTAMQRGGKVTTDLGIKYGRTRYDLEGGGLEHQATLRSPNSTLAVRGTRVSLLDQPPFAPQAVSLTGRAEFAANRRRAIAFGGAGQGKTVVNAQSQTAGDVALAATVIDPTLAGARTESEQALLTTVLSRGATVTLDRESGIKIVRGGIPPTDAQLASALPGRLNFVLRWNTDVNLDLGVSTPATAGNIGGEFVYPAAGLNVAPVGGRTAFDHRGGANGGIEVVYFDSFPDGLYAIGGPNLTPGTVATATVNAFLDGQPLDLFDGLSISKTVTQTVATGNPALVIVGVNTPLPFQPPPEPPVLPLSLQRASKATRGTKLSDFAGLKPLGPKQFYHPPADVRGK